MRSPRLLGVLAFVTCLGLLSRTANAMPTVKEVRAAIDAIERSPLTAQEAGHIGTVMAFAQESPDVIILMDPELTAFAGNQADKHAPLLMSAFIAGNIKGQLNNKKAKDDSYSGLQTVFKVYHVIQASEKEYKNASIDNLEALDKQGKLKAKVEEAQKKAQ
jgi:hypothetical protein